MKLFGVFRNWRVDCLLSFFLFLLVLVIIRLFYLQVVKHQYFAALAEKQHWTTQEISAARGEIFSSDGFPLVENQTAYLVYAEPQNIADVGEVAEKLAEVLCTSNVECQMPNVKSISNGKYQISKDEEVGRIKDLLSQNLQWVPVAHKVSEEVKLQIEALGIEGIGFEEEPKRFYPERTLAAHVLGFIGQDEFGLDHGYYGLEGFYNGDLRGRSGRIIQEKDASGAPIPLGGYRKISALDGRDLELTIDRYLQFLVEGHLSAAVEKYGALGGSVVIMEPQTGAILAMANYPTFDPSNPLGVEEQGNDNETDGSVESDDLWRNAAISETYEPGSVLKALTMSAGIDSKTVEPQTTFFDSGPIEVSGYVVDTWDKKHHGEESMIEVLQNSCNVGAAWVGQQLGARKLRDYFLHFGLGSPTGVDLEGEDTGLVKELSEWRPIDLANAAFGQGISVTPLQLVSAFSAIVNGGKRMRPFIVASIFEDGHEIQTHPKVVDQPISPKTSKIMVEMLTQAVEGGESKFYNLKTHKVAGKTGTAQIPVGGAYDPYKTNATFVGFLPSYPRFVMLVMLKQPSSSIYAAETAVPLFMEIMQELIVYFGIEPDK